MPVYPDASSFPKGIKTARVEPRMCKDGTPYLVVTSLGMLPITEIALEASMENANRAQVQIILDEPSGD